MRSMSIPLFLMVSAFLILAGCGSDSGDQAPPMQQADDQGGGGAGGGGGEALIISSRTYAGGSTQARVSGFFEVNGSQDLNKPASITDDGHTWLQYGVSGAQELDVLFTNSEEMVENGVIIGLGPYTVTVTSTSGECRTKIDVTPATVSGHFSCPEATGYNKDTGQMGKVSIEVDFNASS